MEHLEGAMSGVALQRATQKVYAQGSAHPVESIQKDVRCAARLRCSPRAPLLRPQPGKAADPRPAPAAAQWLQRELERQHYVMGNVYGTHLPMRIKMEMNILSQAPR